MKVSLRFLCVLVLLAVITTGCRKEANYLNLPDLGGVFSVYEKDLDFSNEISGRLPDDDDDVAFQEIIDVFSGTEAFAPSGDKIRGWGLKRSPNNQPPVVDPGAAELLKKYGGKYIGDTSKKTIYLTFDEGYENGYTPKILDVLKKHNVKAIFFITGPYLNQHQDLVRRMIEEGHTVGNHTVHHPSLPTLSNDKVEEEVLGLDRAFKEKFGRSMKFLRPPKGEYSERTLAITQKLGYCNLFWSLAYDDWYRDKIRGPDYAYQKVMSNLHNGAVILLHAVSKDNADALDRIIRDAIAKGYRFGDINELLNE